MTDIEIETQLLPQAYHSSVPKPPIAVLIELSAQRFDYRGLPCGRVRSKWRPLSLHDSRAVAEHSQSVRARPQGLLGALKVPACWDYRLCTPTVTRLVAASDLLVHKGFADELPHGPAWVTL